MRLASFRRLEQTRISVLFGENEKVIGSLGSLRNPVADEPVRRG